MYFTTGAGAAVAVDLLTVARKDCVQIEADTCLCLDNTARKCDKLLRGPTSEQTFSEPRSLHWDHMVPSTVARFEHNHKSCAIWPHDPSMRTKTLCKKRALIHLATPP